jgi:hypothetical protein
MSSTVVNPNAPFGFILMENDNTFQEVHNLDVIKDNHLFFIRFDTVLQSLDCINRNRRYYKGDAIYQSITTPEVYELIQNNKLQSEAGHPVDGSPARIATIDPKFTCNIIKKMWRDGNLIRGSIETLDDNMYGTKLTKGILQDINPSYSYRGFAVLDKKGNISYVMKPPRFITYDEVNLPSHKEAYADPKKIKVAKSYSGQETVYENTTTINTEPLHDASRAILGSDIQEMLVRDSDNLKVVCESFDLDPSTLTTYGNHSFSIGNGKDTFVFQAEMETARRYADLWKRL